MHDERMASWPRQYVVVCVRENIEREMRLIEEKTVEEYMRWCSDEACILNFTYLVCFMLHKDKMNFEIHNKRLDCLGKLILAQKGKYVCYGKHESRDLDMLYDLAGQQYKINNRIDVHLSGFFTGKIREIAIVLKCFN